MANETWTIKRCLDWTRDYLRDKGDERPRVSAEWLLSHVTGLTRTGLYVSFDKPMAADELAAMHEAVVRRAKGAPLQYITGETSFRGITVGCAPGVLIPRPETELLVEEVLGYLDGEVLGEGAEPARERVELPWNAEVEAARQAELAAAEQAKRDQGVDAPGEGIAEGLASGASGLDAQGDGADSESNDQAVAASILDKAAAERQALGGGIPSEGPALAVTDVEPESLEGGDPCEEASVAPPRNARVLEVGCGTGCISLSIAVERPGRVACVAIDIEPRAVDLAIRNRDALGIAPEVVDVRLGNLVSPLDRETEWGTFDVLVSNPPYIPSKVMETLPHEVADFEPALALDGGVDGLDIFRRLVNAAPHMLRPGGLLACELFEGHLHQAADLCRAAGMTDVRIVDDLANRPRIILARV